MSTRARPRFQSRNASHHPRSRSRSAAHVALVLAATALTTCGTQDPATLLTARYPQAALRILAGPGFTRAGRGFVPSEPAPGGGDPVKAAEASLARRRGLRLELPEDGADPAAMTLPGGVAIEVRERGLTGHGVPAGGSVAYPRADGTSYWMTTGEGFEEWVEVENAEEGPVAQWDVKGATLRQEGDVVLVADSAGTARARVTAPQAYSAGGAEARAWLRTEGQVIALYTDARGPALVDPMWTTVGSMAATRGVHTATLLQSGKVLVAGGQNGTGSLASAELYDPATGTWSVTGSLAAARSGHTATLLASGKVLVAGGQNSTGSLDGAELYDPATGTWSATGPLVTARHGHTATLLQSGKVLVAGGQSSTGYLASAELYDPTADKWSITTGALATARGFHTATLLASGKVLVAGGAGSSTGPYTGSVSLASAELYDPATGAWSGTGSLPVSCYSHTATLLPSGKVLVSGGLSIDVTGFISTLASAVLYDPAKGTWSGTGPLAAARSGHTATLLPSGQVLVTGGSTAGFIIGGTYLASAEMYDPAAGTWSSAGSLATARDGHTATLLPSGQVLVVGGEAVIGFGVTYFASVELLDPAVGGWSATGLPGTGRASHRATLVTSGKVLVAGGYDGTNLSSAEMYDPVSGNWSSTGQLATARSGHTATLLPSGKVLVAGGYGPSGTLASAELYDPATGNWSSTGQLATARSRHTATLLHDGKVLVAGGWGTSTSDHLASAELYDPATGRWSATGSLTARDAHTATLLPSGKVLVAGGNGSSGGLASAELYDPAAGANGTWSTTGSLATARSSHTATLLQNGKVLVAGGYVPGSPIGTGNLASAELYDPLAGTWSTTGSLATARSVHSATLLLSGKVLVAGGSGNLLSGTLVASAELYDPAAGTWSTTGSLATARSSHTATLLPSGKVLVAGGYGGSNLASAEIYDEGRGAQPSWTPAVTSGPHVVTGGMLTLGGTLFSGVSEGSGGNMQSSPTNCPLVQLQAADSGALTYAPPSSWSATSLTVGILRALPMGPYWLRVIVSGVPSAAWQVTTVSPLQILPSGGTVPPKGSLNFTASGGAGPYTWQLSTNASGGSISSSGAYTVGATGGVTDVVQVVDSLGNAGSVSVTVTPNPHTGSGGGCGCGNGGGSSLFLIALGALSLSRARPERRGRVRELELLR